MQTQQEAWLRRVDWHARHRLLSATLLAVVVGGVANGVIQLVHSASDGRWVIVAIKLFLISVGVIVAHHIVAIRRRAPLPRYMARMDERWAAAVRRSDGGN